MNRPSEELLHKTLENRATAAEAASVAEWLATDSGQAWASRYIGRDFDRQESCGDYEREEVASERIFARIKTALTRGRGRRSNFCGARRRGTRGRGGGRRPTDSPTPSHPPRTRLIKNKIKKKKKKKKKKIEKIKK